MSLAVRESLAGEARLAEERKQKNVRQGTDRISREARLYLALEAKPPDSVK